MTERQGRAGPGARTDRIRPLVWVDVAAIVVLVMLALLGFEPAFGGYGFLLAGLGGLALGAASGLLGAILRPSVAVFVLAAVALYLLFGSAFAVPDRALLSVLPTPSSLSSLATGSVFGWSDLLTLPAPAGTLHALTVVPYLATWLVSLVSVSLVARWLPRRPRAAWRFGVVLIGPVALYLLGILVGTHSAYLAGVRGVVFAVVVLLWVALSPAGRQRIRAGRSRRRAVLGTAVVVVGAVVLGGGAVAWSAAPTRFVLRDQIQPPFDPLEYPSPLAGFRHYSKQVPGRVLFTVTGLKTGDVIRLATLDSFTGTLWNVAGEDTGTSGSGAFVRVGQRLPEPPFVTPEVRRNVTFTIDDYRDHWIPSLGYPTELTFTGGRARVDGDDLRYNDSTGTALLTSGLAAGDRYELNAEVQRVMTSADLAATPVASIAQPPVVGSPEIVATRARALVGSAQSPAARLEAIRLAMTQGGYLSHGRDSDAPSRAGSGADRIEQLLDGQPMVGDQEQYASAFALMARSLGYPARVVMGFAPRIAEGQKTVEVTGSDVTAFVEVAFDSVGWVAFDPTPDTTEVPPSPGQPAPERAEPQAQQPPRTQSREDTPAAPPLLGAADSDRSDPSPLPRWVYPAGSVLAGLIVLLLLPMIAVAVLRRRRARRRRGTGRGPDRAAGAWEELIDRCAELGYVAPHGETRGAVAERLESLLTRPGEGIGLVALAASTDEAVFSGGEVDDERVGILWTEATAAIALARRSAPAIRRLLSRYRLGSIVGASVQRRRAVPRPRVLP